MELFARSISHWTVWAKRYRRVVDQTKESPWVRHDCLKQSGNTSASWTNLGRIIWRQLKLKSRIHCPSIWPCLIALFSRFRAFWMHPRFFECIRLHFTDWIFQSPCVFVLWQAASSPITIIRFKRSSPKVVNKLLKCFQIVTFHTQATSSIGVPPPEPSTGESS